MGYAKYHEDDLEIYDERMSYRDLSTLSITQNSYTKATPKTAYSFFCPFCGRSSKTYEHLISHVLTSHGGVHEFIYLNNRRVYGGVQTVSRVYSLKLYSFRKASREIQLTDNAGNTYSFWTQKGKYEYDIQSFLHSQLYSELYSEIRIANIDSPVCIRQRFDINIVSVDKILSGQYMSYLFDDQISEGRLTPNEYLIYMKMLICEGSETKPFIEYIEQMHPDDSRELRELYYYQLLQAGTPAQTAGKIQEGISRVLLSMLDGKYSEADTILSGIKGHSDDKRGCQIILDLLKNDKLGSSYLVKNYEPYGLIGTIEKILYHYANYESENSKRLSHEFDEIRLFSQYPLIRALIELDNAINHRGTLSRNSYILLRELTPLAAINYCYGLDDESEKENVLKSMINTHKDSALIKEYALKKDYVWMKRRIFVSDGDLYREAVLEQNRKAGNLFSQRYIEDFPFDDQIQITPLGGEREIGASCFVVSYKGYNIMLDCGIDGQKYGDDAYPLLDLWEKEIDTIVISHAHIDHSGGTPKAHSMWPQANIIATAPTKVFLKYMYSDMAKVKSGIADDFEIDNVTIEKEVMLDTLNSMTTVGYEEWISLRKDIKMRLHPAGHIVGAAMIELVIAGKTILYTGDYCSYNQILSGNYDLHVLPQNIDYLITEATYMTKPRVDWQKQYEEMKNAILRRVSNGQAILLPAASIGRSQELACLIGEMKLSGEISEDIPLYIAGMAIPATTQIVPFMNEKYESIIGLFEEFDGVSYPENNAIVIASSGSMSKGSASYKIAKRWDAQWVNYSIIANGYLDEDSEADCKLGYNCGAVQRLSLSTHADLKGIFELIEYVSPKVISFVHRGKGTEADSDALISDCRRRFSNDILCRDLKVNRSEKIFDMYEWLTEVANENV